MKKTLLTVFSIFAMMLAPIAAVIATSPAASAASCNNSFLGFVSWHNGLEKNSDCTIKSPSDDGSGTKLATFVWTIALNILVDLFTATGYLAVFFVAYGGYLFILSDGDPGKMAKGQKTLIAAITGLLICIFANIIVRTIITILTGGGTP